MIYQLKTPLAAEVLAPLRIGDIVYLSGTLVTARDDVHHRHLREGVPLPVDLRGGAIFHAGPIMVPAGGVAENRRFGAEGGATRNAAATNNGLEMRPPSNSEKWKVVSIGPTTSMRMENAEAEFIAATGVRLIVGKGGMGGATAAACKRHGAVHAVFPGGCAALAAGLVEKVEGVEWLDLGMPEALWVMRVKEFGPLIVSIDAQGGNLFEDNKKIFAARKDAALEKLFG